MPTIRIDPGRVRHIFRRAPGHLLDTSENREALLLTVRDETHFVGTDAYGNRWYARDRLAGGQLWAVVRGAYLINGGFNEVPRKFELQ